MRTLLPRPPAARAVRSLVLWAALSVTGLVLWIAALAVQPHGAAAAVAPQRLPLRDVAVRYTVTVPGRAPHDYDLSFSAESGRLRIDDPARGLWFLVDLREASATMVVPGMHMVVTEPDLANLTAILESAKTAQFKSLGEATIAGLRCTRYSVLSKEVNGTACLTRDGVALEVSGQDSHGSAEAIADSVTEGTVPAGRLVPPPGFARLSLPPGTIAALLGK